MDFQLEKEKIELYFNGQKDILKQYAWWKDGIEYVGCGVETLKEALEDINNTEHHKLDCLLNVAQKQES